VEIWIGTITALATIVVGVVLEVWVVAPRREGRDSMKTFIQSQNQALKDLELVCLELDEEVFRMTRLRLQTDRPLFNDVESESLGRSIHSLMLRLNMKAVSTGNLAIAEFLRTDFSPAADTFFHSLRCAPDLGYYQHVAEIAEDFITVVRKLALTSASQMAIINSAAISNELELTWDSPPDNESP